MTRVLRLALLLPVVCAAGRGGLSVGKGDTVALEVSTPGGGLCPGKVEDIIVSASVNGGAAVRTKGAGEGTVPRKTFEIEMTLGEALRQGKVRLDADPHLSYGRPAEVTVTMRRRPEVRTVAEVPARYDCEYTLDLRGQEGRAGTDAQEFRGPDNSVQCIPGDDATTGLPGRTLTVYIQAVPHPETSSPLLQVEVRTQRRPLRFAPESREADSDYLGLRRYLLDAYRGRLVVQSRGGYGGPAGRGVSNCYGGDAGDGGDGGNIHYIVSPTAQNLMDPIAHDIRGGPGGPSNGSRSGGRHGLDGDFTMTVRDLPPSLW